MQNSTYIPDALDKQTETQIEEQAFPLVSLPDSALSQIAGGVDLDTPHGNW